MLTGSTFFLLFLGASDIVEAQKSSLEDRAERDAWNLTHSTFNRLNIWDFDEFGVEIPMSLA
jgi:hypothetical protein